MAESLKSYARTVRHWGHGQDGSVPGLGDDGFAAREASWLIADAQPRLRYGQFDGIVEYGLEKEEVDINVESRVDQDKVLDDSNCPLRA